MKYLLSILLFLGFLFFSPVIYAADVATGVELPQVKTMERLNPSQYGFQWVKFQYPLGSDPQALQKTIADAKIFKKTNDQGYSVLINISRNQAGIETLKNPGADYSVGEKPDVYSNQYCPWDTELESYDFTYDCGTTLEPETCTETIKSKPYPNGYVNFMNKLKDLAPSLTNAEAVEIWNEPNSALEWSDQGLGNISPENYANFLICGVKGLKKGGYTGKIISAGLAPENNVDFLNKFLAAGGLNSVDAIGWHSNYITDTPPDKDKADVFQGVKNALNKGKPVWVTEFGWKRDVMSGDEDEQKRQYQAQYIAQAYIVGSDLGNISNMFIWNFGFGLDDPNNPQITLISQFDIEGTIAQGELCQPNDQNAVVRDLNTKAVSNNDPSFLMQEETATIAGLALIPKTVLENVAAETATISGTQVDVSQSFINTIPGLAGILKFLNIMVCGFTGFLGSGELTGGYCQLSLSVGAPEQPDSSEYVPGKNTVKYAANSKILGQSSIPAGMELIPAQRDCNLGKLGEDMTEGNARLDTLSKNLGTNTGFFRSDQPTLANYEDCVKKRMEENKNFGLEDKLFNQDRRSADIYCSKQINCKGSYPNGICPFEPSPTPTPTPSPTPALTRCEAVDTCSLTGETIYNFCRPNCNPSPERRCQTGPICGEPVYCTPGDDSTCPQTPTCPPGTCGARVVCRSDRQCESICPTCP